MEPIFGEIFNTKPQNNSLRDRMKTVIARAKAKAENKDEFCKILCADYIKISKEI